MHDLSNWELIYWGENNFAFDLSETQMRVIFKVLGIEIIDSEESTQIHQYTDRQLEKYLEKRDL